MDRQHSNSFANTTKLFATAFKATARGCGADGDGQVKRCAGVGNGRLHSAHAAVGMATARARLTGCLHDDEKASTW